MIAQASTASRRRRHPNSIKDKLMSPASGSFEWTRSSTWRFVALALTALIVLVAVVLTRGTPARPVSANGNQQPSNTQSAAAEPVRSPDASERQEVVRTASMTSAARLIVVDAWGRAMSDVGVWKEKPSTDWYVRSDGSFLGVTGDDGVFPVPAEAVGEALQVGRPGFLTQRLSVDVGMTAEVKLAEGGLVRFLCSFGDGEGETPAPDIEVIVAKEAESVFPLPGQFPEIPADLHRFPEIPADGVPASPVDRIAFRGRSRPDGLVELRGLPPGKLAWCAWGKDLVLSDGPGQTPPDATPVLADGTVHELVFVRMMAAGYRIVGDQVVSSKAKPVPPHPPRIAPFGMMVRYLIEKRLREAFPDAMVFVLSGNTGAVVKVTLVLRERGRHEFELPFLPVEEFERIGPVVVDAAVLAREGTASEALTIRIFNPDGTELPPMLGRLWAEDETMILPARTGQPVLVSHGRYVYLPEQEIVRNCLPNKGRIKIDATARDPNGRVVIDIVLSHLLRPVSVVRPGEITQVKVVNEDSRLVTLVNLDPAGERTTVFLPDGQRIMFLQGGTETVLGRVDLSVPKPEPVVVRLETAR